MKGANVGLFTLAAVLLALTGAASFGVGRALQQEDPTIHNAKLIRSGFWLSSEDPSLDQEVSDWLKRGRELADENEAAEGQKKDQSEALTKLEERLRWPEDLDRLSQALELFKDNRTAVELLKKSPLNREIVETAFGERFLPSTDPLQQRADELPKVEDVDPNSITPEEARKHLEAVQVVKSLLTDLVNRKATPESIKAWAQEEQSKHEELESHLRSTLEP